MDWGSVTYNKLEGLAVAADRLCGLAIDRCQRWVAGHRFVRRAAAAAQTGQAATPGAADNAGPSRPHSA